MKAAQGVEEGVPPRWVNETSRGRSDRRAQYGRAGQAEAARSDAAVVRLRAEEALVVGTGGEGRHAKVKAHVHEG